MDFVACIKQIVKEYGTERVAQRSFIGLLEDYQAFEDLAPSYKLVLKHWSENGKLAKISRMSANDSQWKIDVSDIIHQTEVEGFKKEVVSDLLHKLLLGIGIVDSSFDWNEEFNHQEKSLKKTISNNEVSNSKTNPTSQPENKKGGFFTRLFGSNNNNASISAEECYQNAISAKNNSNNSDYIEWLKKAALKGKADAMFELGEIYTNGGPIDVDVKEAKKWYKMGADKRHTLCMLNYSGICLIENKYETALKYAKKPAENKYFDAFAIIGICYYMKGSKYNNEDDIVTAYSWLLKAVSMSNPGGSGPHDISMNMYKMALVFTGYCCLSDMGIPRQPQKAKKYIEKAASLGCIEAKDFLTMAEKERIF